MKFLIQLLTVQAKRRFAKVSALVVVTLAATLPHLAHAQAASGDTSINAILNSINIYTNVLLRTLSSVFWPVLLMIGSLLDTGLIFGGPMEERLLSAWVEIRNLVNIIFVLILVAVAIYNVLGLGEDGGPLPLGYKKVMPQFVIALILVNFSFVGVKMVLDLSNVVTGAVFALPAKTIAADGVSAEMEKAICSKRAKEVPVYNLWCTSEKKFNETAKQYFNQLDRNNISVVYAIRYGKATELKFIREGVKDLGQLGFNIIFNTILFIVYTIGFIALFLVLATRLVVIWLALVMSPLFALTMVLPNLSQLGGGIGDVKDKVIGSIVAPITIGLTMSVGYIMLDALSVSSAIDPMLSSSSLTAIDANALPTNITTLQQLLVAVGSIVVVWKGVQGAAEKTYASGIVGGIMNKVLAIGTGIAKLPLLAPIIPVGAKKPVSLLDADVTLNNALNSIRGDDFLHKGPDKGDVTKAINYLSTEKMTGLVKVLKDLPHTLRDPATWKELKSLLLTLNLRKEDKEEITKLSDNAKPEEIARVLTRTQNDQIIQAVKAAGFEGNYPKLLQAINERLSTEEVTSVQDMQKIINGNQSEAMNASFMSQIKDKDSFMNIMRQFKSEQNLQLALMEIDQSTNQLSPTGMKGVDTGNAPALLNFFKGVNALTDASSSGDIQKLISDAHTANIKDDVLLRVLKTASGSKVEDVKKVINTVPGATP